MTITAKFEIEYQQCLDADGRPRDKFPAFANDSQHLIKLYRLMTLMRIFDGKAVSLQRTGKIGTYAGILGQEAISVAIGDAMAEDDVLCPAYREYGAFIQRGGKLADIFAYWGGDERGSCFTHKEDLPICVPIATQCLHAVGVAVAIKLRKQPRAVVTVCGDGGTSQGDFYEAVNLAGDWNLPVVFVINNNQWAISVPRDCQSGAKTLAQKAIAGGFNGIQVDGNDVIAVREVVGTALTKARAGEGPSLIEAVTYRLCDHTTADDAKRYRDDEEVNAAWQKEPLRRLRSYLTRIDAWNQQKEDNLLASCTIEVENALQEYTSRPPQPPEAIFDYLYERLPEPLVEQRNELLGSRSS